MDHLQVTDYIQNEKLRKQDEKYKKIENQRNLADFLRRQAAERVGAKTELKTR